MMSKSNNSILKVYIIGVIVFFIISGSLYSLSNYTKPFYDDPQNHSLELNQLPAVKAFHSHYGNVTPFISDDENNSYAIVYQTTVKNNVATLKISYFAWQPWPIVYTCSNLEEKTLFFISDKVEEIRNFNCFE